MTRNLMETLLSKRYYECYGYDDCGSSTWNTWGRWVALAGVVIVAFILAIIFSRVNARRRYRRGAPPMYGTGWFAGKPPGGGSYYSNQYNNGPAPPYAPAGGPVQYENTGNTFNSNDGYYGQAHGQQNGIELQHPQSSYQPQRGGDSVYQPPVGAPPSKGDGIVR